MHVVIYAHYLPPAASASATRMMSLARYLREGGHTVTMLTSMAGPDSVEGFRIVRARNRAGLVAWLARQPRAVLFASSPPATPCAEVAMAARALGWRVMVDVRDPYVIEAAKLGEIRPGFALRVKAFLEWTLPRSAHVMSFVSEFLRDEFGRFTGHPLRHAVIAPNGADLGIFGYDENRRAQARQALALGDEALFCYQGILGGKELDRALDALAPTLREGAKLLVMGIVDEHSRPLKEAIHRQLEALGLSSQLIWRENLALAELAALLPAADFGVNPLPAHRAYCLPVKTYEYLASGVYNIAHGASGSALASRLRQDEGVCASDWHSFGALAQTCAAEVEHYRRHAASRAQAAHVYGRAASNAALVSALEALAERT